MNNMRRRYFNLLLHSKTRMTLRAAKIPLLFSNNPLNGNPKFIYRFTSPNVRRSPTFFKWAFLKNCFLANCLTCFR